MRHAALSSNTTTMDWLSAVKQPLSGNHKTKLSSNPPRRIPPVSYPPCHRLAQSLNSPEAPAELPFYQSLRLVSGSPGRSGRRYRVHFHAEQPALRVGGEGAPGREACALRETVHGECGRGEEVGGAGEGEGVDC